MALLTTLALALSSLTITDPAGATTAVETTESQFVSLLNQTRSQHGLSPLLINSALASTSRTWSGTMASSNTLKHDPNLAGVVSLVVPGWTRVGENVGYGYSVQSLHDAFYASAGHRANMLGDYNQVGIGVVYGSGGQLWVTVRFVKGPVPVTTSAGAGADRVGLHRPNAFYLRKSLSSGPASISYTYGSDTDVAVMGDWNGDGVSTPGVFRNGIWYLRNSNSGGSANVTLTFGMAGDIPVVGDWDGNRTDTIGVWRAGRFFLRNANSTGSSNGSFSYGGETDTPLVGDWDGNRTDTVGIRRGSTFHLRNANSGGNAHVSFSYGLSTDTPVMGDWDGNRTDTVGIRRGSTFYLRNANSGGNAQISFSYGTSTDKVLVGGW